jgi:hypothetical protein
MKNIFKITFLFLSLTLIQCSSDDDTSSSSGLLYNGAEFKTGQGVNYNYIKSENDGTIWFNIREKGVANPKTISIYASHEVGTHTGTYTLKPNMIGPGLAVMTIMNDQDEQLLGADYETGGTITISDYGNHKLKVTFNDVSMSVGTAEPAIITGSCLLNFTPIAH